MAEKCRNWTFILYPESARPDWRDFLDNFHLEWIESPLHDSDIKNDGTPKKPHYHIVLCFSGVKSYEQVAALTAECGGTIPQRVEQLRACVRYLAHLDHPKKAQYKFEDIVPHGGADLEQICKARGTEKYQELCAIFDFLRVNEITEYTQLIDYVVIMHPEWLGLVTEKHCYAITKYIDSIRSQKYTKEK